MILQHPVKVNKCKTAAFLNLFTHRHGCVFNHSSPQIRDTKKPEIK